MPRARTRSKRAKSLMRKDRLRNWRSQRVLARDPRKQYVDDFL